MMKDKKSFGSKPVEQDMKFFASFRNRERTAAARYIEVTVIAESRTEARTIAERELKPLTAFTFQEID